MEQMNSSEDPTVNADQEHQKPQSWLASYQEQLYFKFLHTRYGYLRFCPGIEKLILPRLSREGYIY